MTSIPDPAQRVGTGDPRRRKPTCETGRICATTAILITTAASKGVASRVGMEEPANAFDLSPEQRDTVRLLDELLGQAIAARYEDFYRC